MRFILFALGLLAFIVLSQIEAHERKRYDGYHIYRLEPKNEVQLSFLQSLDRQLDSHVFLDDVLYVNTQIGILVAPEQVSDFEKKLQETEMVYELLDRNAQVHLEDDEVADLTQRGSRYGWKNYYKLEDTHNWLRSLVKLYPKQATVFSAGKSYEGRDLLGIKISHGAGKKAIFLEAGIHAREWISPATATFVINQLLTSKDKDVRFIAENFDWYIVPHTNPDGYVYTHTTNRMWRKTRSPNKYGCYGTDPNRNWDFHWNEVGSSSNPCSQTYAGPTSFSEVETRSLADFVLKLKDKLLLYVSFHSYYQLLLYPYGHTSKLPSNNADLKGVYNAAVAAIRKRYGTKYTGGNIYNAIYPVSGSSVDWAYGVANIKYSYCYELRPYKTNPFGFALPASQIIPTGEETLDSLVAMVKAIKSKM